MKTSISYKRIWQIAYPIILGSIAQNLINFTDTAFLGRVGEVALGAGALGGLFYLAIIMLGLGFGTGAQIIIARRYGENKLKKIGPIVEHSIYFLLPLALLVFVLMRYWSAPLLEKVVVSPDVFEGTIAFLKYRSFGIFFAFMNMVFRSFYVGLAKTKVITYTTIVLAITNIFLDYILIFGKLGFPAMGIEGAAIASVIAEMAAMLFFIVYTYITVRFKDYDLFRFSMPSLNSLTGILRVSVPIMMQSFISLSVWFIFFGLIKVADDPYLIEYNCRMGDPEAESVIPRVKSDLLELLIAAGNQSLDKVEIEFDERSAATVMIVSEGYPEKYKKGKLITIPDNLSDCLIFHSGTTTDIETGLIKTSGGRVIAVTSYGRNMQEALDNAYKNANLIDFNGKNFRKDIGFDLNP